jgi:hypothetical protein
MVNSCTVSPGVGTGTTAGDASGDAEVTITYDLPTPTLLLVDPSGTPTVGSNTYDVTLDVLQGGSAPSQNVTVSDGTQSCNASLSNPSTDGTTWTGLCTLGSEQLGATVAASYPGDTNYSATTAPTTLTVGPDAASLSLVDPSGTPKAGSNTYDVTLTVPPGAPAPSQSVTVTDGTQSCDAALSNPSADGTTWTGSCALNNEQANATVSASYTGDTNYTNANAATTLTIGKSTPTLSAPVTGSTTSGQAITATTSLGGGDVPSGTIVFKAYGNSTCTGTAAFASSSTSVSGDGHYAATGLSTTTPGTYYLDAVYSGDGNNAAITSACSTAFSVTPATKPPTFTSSTTAYFSWLGANTTFQITASGSPAPTITESGTLPQGLHFNASTDTISGVAGPLALGSHTVTLTASNGVGPAATQKLVIVVGFAPAILTPPTTTFTEGRTNGFTFVSCAYPTATLSESGTLPPGVTFTAFNNGAAQLSGVPGTQSLSTYVFTVTANTGFATSSQTFVLRLSSPPPKK